MVRKNNEVENITGHFMASLGFYRVFYIFNWYILCIILIGYIDMLMKDFIVGHQYAEDYYRLHYMLIFFTYI